MQQKVPAGFEAGLLHGMGYRLLGPCGAHIIYFPHCFSFILRESS